MTFGFLLICVLRCYSSMNSRIDRTEKNSFVLFYYGLLDRSIGKDNFEVVWYPTIISSFAAISDFGVTLCCMLRDSYMI